jgi:hypothetical protein
LTEEDSDRLRHVVTLWADAIWVAG